VRSISTKKAKNTISLTTTCHNVRWQLPSCTTRSNFSGRCFR